jgi:cytoskeletal protein CcmA (bactofilin family)
VCSYFYLNTKEGFTFDPNMQEILPISISEDNGTISVPNTVKGLEGDSLTFGGDIIASRDGRVNKDFYVNNTLTAKDVTVTNKQTVNGDMDIIGNLSGDKDGLKIKGSLLANDGAKVEGNLDVNGTLNVTGDLNVKNLNVTGGKITIGAGDAQWTLEASGKQENWLEFYNQNRKTDSHGMVLIAPEGDIWNNQTGWSTDMKSQVTQAKTAAAAKSKGGGSKGSGIPGIPGIPGVPSVQEIGGDIEDFFVDDVGGFFGGLF